MKNDFNWTPETIASFWNEVAGEQRLQEMYFSKHHAKNLITLAKLFGLKNSSMVLDYGCGPGYLSAELVSQGFNTAAIEFSDASAAAVNKKLGSFKNWLQCRVHKGSHDAATGSEFDWIFSIETYEHLLDEWVDGYLDDLKSKLKSGGKLLLSTPSNEHMDSSLIICPNCHQRFHRWGHLRSVSEASLKRVFTEKGFEIHFCKSIDLNRVGRTSKPRSHKRGLAYYAFARLAPWVNELLRRLIGGKFTTASSEEIPLGSHLIIIASLGSLP